MDYLLVFYFIGCVVVAFKVHNMFMDIWSGKLPKAGIVLGWVLTISLSWVWLIWVEVQILLNKMK
jgi:hypothetical protein